MSTIPVSELQHRLAQLNGDKQRARENELKNLRVCMQKQAEINGQFIDRVIEKTSP